MDLFTAIESRRSIKHYDPEFQIPPEIFEKMMNATLLSPTSYNIQHWRFLRVTDTDKRQALKDAAWGQQQIEDASELLMLCADVNAWSDKPERYWSEAPSETRETLVSMMTDFYENKPRLQRDEAIRSCGIAAQTLMLSATALGLESGAIIGFDPDEVATIVNLPEHYLIGLIVVIGKAAQPAKTRGGQLPLREVLFENQF